MSNETQQQYIRPAPRKVTGQRPPAPVDADGALAWDEPTQSHASGPGRNVVNAIAPQPSAPTISGAPRTAAEAAQRFYRRYGLDLARLALGDDLAEPTTVAEWTDLAHAVKAVVAARAAARKRVQR